jgi:hypothetical protein
MMYKFLIYMALTLPTAAIASTCTDDYIISGGRKIDLLPDFPFNIQQMNSSISIQRREFILIFSNMKEISERNLRIKRYSLEFLGDQYHFDLIHSLDDGIKRWEQYSTGVGSRGFGGVCRD